MVSDTVSGGFTGFHDYAPFGEEVQGGYAGRTSDWGTLSNGTDFLSQRYTAAERDTETTLDFLQARYLANQQARFVTVDPAGNFVADPTSPQSWNMYSYARSNPLAFLDPTGLCTVVDGQYAEDGGQPCPPPPSSSITVDDGGNSVGLSALSPGCYEIFIDGFDSGSTCAGGGGGTGGGGGGGGGGGSVLGGFSIRAPGQTFKACMAANASTYSVGGAVELGINVATGTNTSYSSNPAVGAIFGNSINTFFFGSTDGKKGQ